MFRALLQDETFPVPDKDLEVIRVQVFHSGIGLLFNYMPALGGGALDTERAGFPFALARAYLGLSPGQKEALAWLLVLGPQPSAGEFMFAPPPPAPAPAVLRQDRSILEGHIGPIGLAADKFENMLIAKRYPRFLDNTWMIGWRDEDVKEEVNRLLTETKAPLGEGGLKLPRAIFGVWRGYTVPPNCVLCEQRLFTMLGGNPATPMGYLALGQRTQAFLSSPYSKGLVHGMHSLCALVCQLNGLHCGCVDGRECAVLKFVHQA